ncbi:hypothetical protein [Lysobacter gummosus]
MSRTWLLSLSTSGRVHPPEVTPDSSAKRALSSGPYQLNEGISAARV